MHIWDCPDAPADGAVVDVYAALEVLRTATDASACAECGATVALGPLLTRP
ncbi:hypothetical protein OG784_31825 [Streptomyces sp. NBC_01617]|uniref:hypothetical protein n=1 Tax=unclassified Streptomyces TaxID=2593676 RepID=UPI00386F2969|nr:hypothetical protein OG987_31975 [Streptomyces sp. NBC_01620]WTE65194.1 hypothetical protein OG784_31825 [Streptomyces sp. NBC_01617]